MKRTLFSAAPAWSQLAPALAALALFGLCADAWAQTGNKVKVEEEWELVLTEPDSATVAPQVTCTMSPTDNLGGTYWTFEINHLTAPSFSPGGLHIHQWNGEWRQSTFSRSDRSVMHTANETVTWTQSLRANGSSLTFEVQNGTSSTWGPFGFGNFQLTTGWGVSNINSYSPEVSVANAGVGFAANRVASLKLIRVRTTYADGQTVTDNTERVVYQQQ